MSRAPSVVPARPAYLARLLVIDGGRATFLAIDQIDWIGAERNYVNIAAAGTRYRLRATIASIAERLDPAQFMRINRSTIVRLDAARSITEWSHGDFRVAMHDGTELIWSRRFRDDAKRLYGVNT